MMIERLADKLSLTKGAETLKIVAIKGIPRMALLKPAHAATRLSEQTFDLGDRVMTVSDSGTVPLSAKGVIVGIQVGFVDVVFDVAFIGGTTLGDRYANLASLAVDLTDYGAAAPPTEDRPSRP